MECLSVTRRKYDIPAEALTGACTKLDTFEYLNRLGEGSTINSLQHGDVLTALAYGVVFRARDKRDDSIVALKTIRIFESDKGEGSTTTEESLTATIISDNF